jgi:hypothetical protein
MPEQDELFALGRKIEERIVDSSQGLESDLEWLQETAWYLLVMESMYFRSRNAIRFFSKLERDSRVLHWKALVGGYPNEIGNHLSTAVTCLSTVNALINIDDSIIANTSSEGSPINEFFANIQETGRELFQASRHLENHMGPPPAAG